MTSVNLGINFDAILEDTKDVSENLRRLVMNAYNQGCADTMAGIVQDVESDMSETDKSSLDEEDETSDCDEYSEREKREIESLDINDIVNLSSDVDLSLEKSAFLEDTIKVKVFEQYEFSKEALEIFEIFEYADLDIDWPFAFRIINGEATEDERLQFEEYKKYWEEDIYVINEDEDEDDDAADDEDCIGLQLMIQDAIRFVEAAKELDDSTRTALLVPRMWKNELAVESMDRSEEFYDFLQAYYEELEDVLEANDDARGMFDEKVQKLESLLRLKDSLESEDGITSTVPPVSPTSHKDRLEALEHVRIAESLIAVGYADAFSSAEDRAEWEQRVDDVTPKLELLLDGLADKKALSAFLNRKRKIEEIIVEQRRTDLCIEPRCFERLVREVGQDYNSNLEFTSEALEALQWGAEAFLIERFQDIQAGRDQAIADCEKISAELAKKRHAPAPTAVDALTTTLAGLDTQSHSTVRVEMPVVSPRPADGNSSDSVHFFGSCFQTCRWK